MSLTLIVAFSPREDTQNRGFIPCTKELADNVMECQGQIWCTTKAIMKNSLCDAKVILRGIKLWITKKQASPWSNYYFTPNLQETDDNTQLFYHENPNYLQDFTATKQEHKKLEEQEANEKND